MLLAAAACCAAGCAKNEELVRRVARLEADLTDFRSLHAEQVAQTGEVRTELRELTGRIETLEHRQTVRLGSEVTELREGLSDLKRRVPPPPIVPVVALDEDENRARSFPSSVAAPFSTGLERIREGKFPGALAALQDALDAAAGNPVTTPYIVFWSALAHEGLVENERAVRGYAELVTRYPKHERTPAALFRQGSVLIRLGDSKAAALAFKRLTAEFPKSPEAARARERLKDL